jgi:hypothetical protein
MKLIIKLSFKTDNQKIILQISKKLLILLIDNKTTNKKNHMRNKSISTITKHHYCSALVFSGISYKPEKKSPDSNRL